MTQEAVLTTNAPQPAGPCGRADPTRWARARVVRSTGGAGTVPFGNAGRGRCLPNHANLDGAYDGALDGSHGGGSARLVRPHALVWKTRALRYLERQKPNQSTGSNAGVTL